MTIDEKLAYIGTMKYDFEQIAITWPNKTKEELLDMAAYHREQYYNGGGMNHSLTLDKIKYILCLRNKYGVTK